MKTNDPEHIKKAKAILVNDAKLLSVEVIKDPRKESKGMYPWLKVTYEYKGKRVTTKIPAQTGFKTELEEK